MDVQNLIAPVRESSGDSPGRLMEAVRNSPGNESAAACPAIAGSLFVQDHGCGPASVSVFRTSPDDKAGRILTVRTDSAAVAVETWRNADAEIVGWVQSGDSHDSRELAAVSNYFAEHPDCDAIYGSARLVDRGGQSLGEFRPRPPTLARLAKRFCLCPSAVFYRKQGLERWGYPDPRWHHGASLDLWIRWVRAGARLDRWPSVLADRQVTPGNALLSNAPLTDVPLAMEELRELLLQHFGSVSDGWALWMGRARALAAGAHRVDSSRYDREVLRGAQLASALPSGEPPGRLKSCRLWLGHALAESREAIKHPTLALRLLPDSIRNSALIRQVRQFRSPRLFRLHCDPPRKLLRQAAGAPCARSAGLPGIALVTPNYNCGAYLERTLKSVLDQGYPDLAYHIQDGASTDNSCRILEQYSDRITSWESIRDRGQADAINRGFGHLGEAPLMGWLNSDDVLLPGALACVGEYFARHPDVDVVYGHRLLIDSGDRIINRWILPPHDDEVIAWADFIPQETMFWRRSIWERAGGRIDDSFQFAMDWDLILRFRRAGARFARLPRLLGAFRITDQQKTSALMETVGKAESDRLRMRELGYLPSEAEVSGQLRSYLRRHWWMDKWYIAGSLLRIPTPVSLFSSRGTRHVADAA